MTQYMQDYRHKRKAEALALLGGRCVTCGKTEDLQFDHIDPSAKIMAIGQMWHAAKGKFWAEVNKCQLLCPEHHQERTSQQWLERPTKHGSNHGYRIRRCRCDECIGWFRKSKREYNARKNKPS